MRKCKECKTDIEEDQARRTFEEYENALCIDCERKLSQAPPANSGPDPGPPLYTIHKMTPDGPIFQAAESFPLPPNAVFHGFYRPRRAGQTFQLFRFIPPLDPATLDPQARELLEAHGFNF